MRNVGPRKYSRPWNNPEQVVMFSQINKNLVQLEILIDTRG